MKTLLYLGTDPASFESSGCFEGHVIHFPVIEIVPRSLDEPALKAAWDDLAEYTHLIFTSKNAVSIFCDHLQTGKIGQIALNEKCVIAVGQVTAAQLERRGLPAHYVAEQEHQEGVVALLNTLELDEAYLFLPRSSLSRPILTHFLRERGIRHQACDLYDTVACKPDVLPDLEQVDEILFTSPSTVSAFLEIFQKLPQGKKLRALGPVTERALLEAMQ